MVNQQPDGFSEQQWYPQLPEGYDVQHRNSMLNQGPPFGAGSMAGMQNTSGLQPGMVGIQGPGGWPPGMNQMPGHGQRPSYGLPGQGMPSYGQQPFGPPMYQQPGHQQPGHQSPGHQQPGRPPGFPPTHQNPGQQYPGQQQWNPPGNQGQQGPTSAPPNFTPEYPEAQLFRVDPGAIRGCLYRYTFIWLSRRQGFWFYPTFVGRTSVAGYRWRRRRRRWEYFGIDLDNIDSFTCF